MRHSLVGLLSLSLFACDHKADEPSTPTTLPSPPAETKPSPQATPTQPGTPTPESKNPLESADSDMREVLEQLAALGGKPIATLTPEEARKQPSPADAVKKVLEKKGKPTTPLEMAKVQNEKIPGAAGQIDARIYTPKTDAPKPLPVIAYWHGGGFVIADLDTYDATPRALAKNAEAIVVSLDYRRAPEAKFPAAHQDAFAGYQWVVKNAASFGGDRKRVAVAGESAGGNLAANVALMARDKKVQVPLHALLVYPVAQSSMGTESYNKWQEAKPLNKAMMVWFVEKYTNGPNDAKDPRISLVDANLAGFPPTTIVNAEIDPLLSDGEMLRDKLKAANVDVSQKTYEGVVHEFFGMGAVVGDAKDAEEWASARLKGALEKK